MSKVEFFHLAGYEQESFSNDADILFVIDNSSSMKEEAQSLGNNFNVFINLLPPMKEPRNQPVLCLMPLIISHPM